MLAARYRVERLHAVVDANEFQEWGWSHAPELNGKPLEELSEKWRAFGWRVLEVDGHDHEALAAVFEDATTTEGRPSLVVARTVKGKGYPLIEADPIRFHCATVSEEEHRVLVRGGE